MRWLCVHNTPCVNVHTHYTQVKSRVILRLTTSCVGSAADLKRRERYKEKFRFSLFLSSLIIYNVEPLVAHLHIFAYITLTFILPVKSLWYKCKFYFHIPLSFLWTYFWAHVNETDFLMIFLVNEIRSLHHFIKIFFDYVSFLSSRSYRLPRIVFISFAYIFC